MSDAVRYDVRDGVAYVVMNRPDAMNAADTAMREGLRSALDRATDDPDVRAVLLTGEGRAFCVGQDLKELLPLYESGDPSFEQIVDGFNEVAVALAELPKPTVAAVNGPAAGAGASLAFGCDFRWVADSASFSMAFSKIGLVPDTGASWLLPRLIGAAKAMEMLMLSEPVKADEALRIGLANRVLPATSLLAEASAFATSLAAGPTVAYGYIKRLVAYGHDVPLRDSLALERDLQDAAGRTDDHANAVKAFLAKEPPTFRGY